MNEILKVEELKVSFQTPEGEVRAVDNVSFVLKEAETLAVIGETGCGKSTLARSILGLPGENASVQGKVLYQEQNLPELSEKELAGIRGKFISFIPQNPELALNPIINVGRQLVEMLKIHQKIKIVQAKEKVINTLTNLGFPDSVSLLKKYPFQLSGGMAQRVLIAAAVLNSPEIIIADEPTRALDRPLRHSIINEFLEIKKSARSSVVLITHDLDLAAAFSDSIAVMYAGEFVEAGDTRTFFKNPLHPYAQVLLDSRPGRGFRLVRGETPSLIEPPAGCKFHPRCRFKKDICSVRKQDLTTIDKRQVRCLNYA